MEILCPLCNALETIRIGCPRCGSLLLDGGALENYYGPYSPYMDVASLQDGHVDTHCVHLLYCAECHFDTRAAWELVVI